MCLDVINGEDFYAWLTRHGANPKLTVHSAPVRGFYDLVFAYEDGDFERPNIEAGTMLRGMMRVAFGYHGAIMWKMQAGMGDVVFTPFYELLERRGVKFEFFHKVDELLPDASGGAVGEIRLTQQVALAAGVVVPTVCHVLAGRAVSANRIPLNGASGGWEVDVHMPKDSRGWRCIIDADTRTVYTKTRIDNPGTKRR